MITVNIATKQIINTKLPVIFTFKAIFVSTNWCWYVSENVFQTYQGMQQFKWETDLEQKTMSAFQLTDKLYPGKKNMYMYHTWCKF